MESGGEEPDGAAQRAQREGRALSAARLRRRLRAQPPPFPFPLQLKGVAAATAAAAAAAALRRPRPAIPSRRRPALPVGPSRRSGRVAGLPPSDHADGLTGTGSTDRALAAPAATYAREAYGPEHLFALGTVADGATWALFTDGYDAKRKRIYTSAGRVCHQCRQKVRATFTSCSICGLLRGGFCGDCLFMRYGEHVGQVRARNEQAEAGGGGGGGGAAAAAPSTAPPPAAAEEGEEEGAAVRAAEAPPTTSTPTFTPWACPPCRGVCNCSFHRSAAGLPPTGSLYRGALAAGFPSVAHYLVLSCLTPAGRRALAAAASGTPGPDPPAAWLAAGPGDGTGSDDEQEEALGVAAGLWERGLAAGVLGRGLLPEGRE